MRLEENGFSKLAELKIGKNGRIDRSFAKGDYAYIIYAWVIDDEILYIGQTKNLYNRMHTYCNAKYWKNSNESNVAKSSLLENAVSNNRKVELFIRTCHKVVFTNPAGSSILSSMDQDELKFIKMFKPKWNVKGNRELKPKRKEIK